MGVNARIIAWNNNNTDEFGCADFSLNCYWGDGYKNYYYICGDLGRPTFNNTIETSINGAGQEVRTQDISVERHNLSLLCTSAMLNDIIAVSKCTNKQLEFIDTGEIHDITNIEINDDGQTLDTVQLVRFWFEDEPVSNIMEDNVLLASQKIASFDNNNDGSADVNGEAQFTGGSTGVFNTWQLYFESDGVTPATSGNVILKAYGTYSNGLEVLLGLFNGVFNDLFSDSTKWQSTQQIWDYFNVSDKVGHAQRIQFDKRAYAEDNGYFSNEINELAIDVRFELSIDGSASAKSTLSKVYTVWGAFHSSGVQSAATSEYGITTIGKIGFPNILNTIADTRQPLAGGASTFVSSANLVSTNAYSATYVLDITPANEQGYDCAFTTKGGFIGSNFRGSFGADNFTLSPDTASEAKQDLNILNYTLGNSPFDVIMDWKYDRQSGGGGFPVLADINAAGDANIFLDGVAVVNLITIPPATLQVLGTSTVTLPDASLHTIRFNLPTTTGYVIYSEFEVQLKPLY